MERERQGGRGLAEDKKKRGKEKAAGTTAWLHPITRLLDVCESLPLSRNKRQDKKKRGRRREGKREEERI